MEALQIDLQTRETTGKGEARKARAEGVIPGIIYGHGKDPLMFGVEGHGFYQAVSKSPFGRNQLFAVRGVGRDVDVIIKELQQHPVTRDLIHVDFLEVEPSDRVTVKVPVKTVGRAAGQSAGGTLQLLRREVKIICSPHAIPENITIDVKPLGIGQDVTVAELPLPEGAVAVGDSRNVVITIKAPRVSGKAKEEEDPKKKK